VFSELILGFLIKTTSYQLHIQPHLTQTYTRTYNVTGIGHYGLCRGTKSNL